MTLLTEEVLSDALWQFVGGPAPCGMALEFGLSFHPEPRMAFILNLSHNSVSVLRLSQVVGSGH